MIYYKEKGKRDFNLTSGKQKANDVKDYQVIQCIDPDRIKLISYKKACRCKLIYYYLVLRFKSTNII